MQITIRGWNPDSNERVEFTLPPQYNEVVIIDGVLDSLRSTMPSWVHRQVAQPEPTQEDKVIAAIRTVCKNIEWEFGDAMMSNRLSEKQYNQRLMSVRSSFTELLTNAAISNIQYTADLTERIAHAQQVLADTEQPEPQKIVVHGTDLLPSFRERVRKIDFSDRVEAVKLLLDLRFASYSYNWTPVDFQEIAQKIKIVAKELDEN